MPGLVGQQHLAVRRRADGRAVILDGVARVDQLEAVGLAPVDHLLIGQARRFPALGIVAPEPDHLIVRGVGHLYRKLAMRVLGHSPVSAVKTARRSTESAPPPSPSPPPLWSG